MASQHGAKHLLRSGGKRHAAQSLRKLAHIHPPATTGPTRGSTGKATHELRLLGRVLNPLPRQRTSQVSGFLQSFAQPGQSPQRAG